MADIADDRRLADGIRHGDPCAFRAAFDIHAQRLADHAGRYLESPEVAEDVVQDVFASLWDLRGRVDQIVSLSSYLFRAVRNRSLNQVRRRRLEARRCDLLRPDPAWGDSPSARIELEELSAAVEAAITDLPPRTREVFLLSRVRGRTYREIAEALGISVKTVEALMARALRRMRRRLAADGVCGAIRVESARATPGRSR